MTGEAAHTTGKQADLAIGGAQLALGFAVATFGPYLATLADELDRPRAELVWITSTFGVGLVLAAVLGPAALRAGPGVVLRFSCLGMAIGTAAMATTPALPVAGAGSVLVGFGGAAITLVTPAMLRGPGAARRLTRAVAAASTAGISAPLAFGLLEYADLPGRLALLLPVPVLLLVAARRTVEVPRREPDRGVKPPVGPATIGWLRIVLAVACEFCFVVWAVARLVDTGASLGTASVLSTGFVIGMAVGRLVGPRFAEHPRAVLVAALTAMTGTAIVYAGNEPATVTIGITIASLGIALLYPITLAQLVAVPNLNARHSASIGSLASGTAILTAPTLLGWLDTTMDLRTAFLLPIPLLIALLALMPKRNAKAVPR
ncbi:MFS transporter [Glycomyces tarimensis]